MQSLTFAYYDIPPTICILAGLIYAFKYKELKSIERFIFLIIILNIVADTTSYIIIQKGKDSHLIYNMLLPVERIITLLIYAANENTGIKKRMHYFGIVFLLAISIFGWFFYKSMSEFHDLSNILSGLVVAVLSYMQLRSIALNTAGQSRLLFYFGLANLIYFTLMISAMSALPLAMQIDNKFASNILSINLFAYSVWSIILIVGILWKAKEKI